MKTSTFLKRTIRTLSVLIILLVLISFQNEQPAPKNSSENFKELAIHTKHLDNTVVAINALGIAIERKDTHILLTVDTETINQNNIDAKVVFSDDRSTPSENPGDPKTFISIVDKNKKVYWSAVPKDPNSGLSIDVLAIFRKEDGGAEIMEDIYIEEGKKGVVVAKIKNKKVLGLENYSVVFRINEDTPRTFVVDPKLEMGGS